MGETETTVSLEINILLTALITWNKRGEQREDREVTTQQEKCNIR